MARSENIAACRRWAATRKAAQSTSPRTQQADGVGQRRGSLGATISPSTPSRIASGTPSTRVAMTGTPAAIASSTTIGNPSPNRLGSTIRSSLAELGRNVAGESGPVDRLGQIQSLDLSQNLRLVGRRFESTDGPQSDRQTFGSGQRKCVEQDFQSLARAEQGDDAQRPDDRSGVRVATNAPPPARRWAPREPARSDPLLTRHIPPGCAIRRSPPPRGPGSNVPCAAFSRLRSRRVESGGRRTVQVINQRHAGQTGGDPPDERRSRRVTVDQPIILLFDQPRNPPGDSQIEPRPHADVPQRCLLRSATLGQNGRVSGRRTPPRSRTPATPSASRSCTRSAPE